jgi:hypothetical protein
MNKVEFEQKYNKIEIQSYSNQVTIELIRIHTDYYFMTYSQTTPDHKEV